MSDQTSGGERLDASQVYAAGINPP
jgi:hypothetical protein